MFCACSRTFSISPFISTTSKVTSVCGLLDPIVFISLPTSCNKKLIRLPTGSSNSI